MNQEELLEEAKRLTVENERLHGVLSEVYSKYNQALMEDIHELDAQEVGEIHSALRVYNKQMKSLIRQSIGTVVGRMEYGIRDYQLDSLSSVMSYTSGPYDPCKYCRYRYRPK